jgi:hypothetical protein
MERRAGTFACWLFGHRFVVCETTYTPHETVPDTILAESTYTPIDHCTRCGASRAVTESQPTGEESHA